MKNLPLIVTLGLVTLMGACDKLESSNPSNEQSTADNSSVILETPEETTAEGINVELEDVDLEAQAEEIPLVDATPEATLEETPLATEEDIDLEAQAEEIPLVDATPEATLEETPLATEEDVDLEAIEPANPESDDVILPADNAEIPVEEEAAELVEPATESAE